MFAEHLRKLALVREPGEEWAPVPDTEAKYWASTHGRIWSVGRWNSNKGGRIVGTGLSNAGGRYHRFTVSIPGRKPREVQVHTAVLLAHVGPPQHGQVCRHMDGDCRNNRIENLTWGTHQENQNDRAKHGTHCKGERNPSAVLTTQAVRQMRGLHADGVAATELAEMYGVSLSAAWAVVNHKTWRHVV